VIIQIKLIFLPPINFKMNLTSLTEKAFLYKFLKFGIVGGTGVIVDFSVTYICKEKFKIHKYLSNSIGFTIAASTNWFLNRIWTFQSHNPQVFTEYSKFLVISMIGLGINTLILWILTDKLKINFYLSKLGAIGVVTIWNFFANYLYTFSS
jgi:putative flippase GtrA